MPSTSLELSYETHSELFIQVDYLILIIFLNQKILMIIMNDMIIYHQAWNVSGNY